MCFTTDKSSVITNGVKVGIQGNTKKQEIELKMNLNKIRVILNEHITYLNMEEYF